MKKNSFWKFQIIFWIIITSFTFLSCGDEATNPDNGQIINPDTDVSDPTGTISLSMHNKNNGNTTLNNISIDESNNFTGWSTYFSSIGKVKGLGNVSDIPTTGWASKVAVTPGYGYVACTGDVFYRIYVDNYITSVGGGIIGADIKYQTPFKGKNEAISLKETALTFKGDGGKQALVFDNKGIIVFNCVSSADWCHVQKSTTYDTPFLYNGVMIIVDPSTTKKTEEAIVTLTTAYGKETKITVTRAGQEPFVKFNTDGEKQVYNTSNTYTENITTNYSPTDLLASSDATWCKVSLQDNSKSLAEAMASIKYVDGKTFTRASNNNEVISCNLLIDIDANNTIKERKCNIIIKSKDGKVSAKLTVVQAKGEFRLNRNDFTVNGEKGTYSVSYNSSLSAEDIVAESDVEWCAVNTDKQNSITLVYDENVNSEQRSATILIKTKADNNTIGTFVLTQKAYTFTIPSEHVWFDRNNGNQTITINTTMSELPTPSTNAGWCTVSVNGKNLTIRVTATPNDRTATISFKDRSEKIKVTQSKYAVGDEYSEGNVTGTVVYMNNEQRLIAKDVGEAVWSIENVLTGANDKFDGMINTDKIKKIPNWQTLYPAFALCDGLNINGVTGWYLPSSNELYNSRIISEELWSSTEENTNSAYYCFPSKRNIGPLPKSRTISVYAFYKF